MGATNFDIRFQYMHDYQKIVKSVFSYLHSTYKICISIYAIHVDPESFRKNESHETHLKICFFMLVCIFPLDSSL